MHRTRRRKLLALLISGAWLPVTISCQPGAFDAVIRAFDGVTVVEEVVVDDGYYYDCYDCGGHGFDFFFDHYGY